MYHKRYSIDGPVANIPGFEVPVPLPDVPPVEEMVNYGLPQSEQKFKRTVVPEDILSWPEREIRAFVSREWHKRLHGLWILINGVPVYIPGQAYFFFNYWYMQSGGLPDFRIEAVWWFQVWDFAEQHPDCMGLLVFKARREGASEKALCGGYERVTRYRNQHFGMQNINENDASQNYERIVYAHKHMPFFFKPVHLGNDSPAEALIFRYQRKGATDDVREAQENTTPALGSRIDYKATRLKMYDGKRLSMYHMDEPGKLSPSEMDVRRQWGIIKHCLTLSNGKWIIGKALFTSTVEEIANGETVKVCRDLWAASNPMALSDVNRTASGLFRYFRNFHHAADVDEFGFHMIEEAEERREAEIKSLLEAGDFDGLSDYKRRVPKYIEEVLSVPSNKCVLLPALLDRQIEIVEQAPKEAVRGDLVWSNGIGSQVNFVPNPINGRWYISQHPTLPNAKKNHNGVVAPGNVGIYTMGVDGYDHKSTRTDLSDGGIAVFRPFDPTIDVDEPEFNYDSVAAMKTDRFVCTYRNRPPNPFDFYEDCAKTALYYGVPMFAERDKPGVILWMEQHFPAFCAFKPRSISVGAAREKQPGMKSSVQSISLGVSVVTDHIARRWPTYLHMNQLNDYRQFTGDNRGECDLLVASEYALLQAKPFEQRNIKNEKQSGWRESPFETY